MAAVNQSEIESVEINESDDITEIKTEDSEIKTEDSEIKTEDLEEVTFKSLGVCAELCEACEQLKWKKPSIIQREALPVALQGKKNRPSLNSL